MEMSPHRIGHGEKNKFVSWTSPDICTLDGSMSNLKTYTVLSWVRVYFVHKALAKENTYNQIPSTSHNLEISQTISHMVTYVTKPVLAV